MVMQNITTPVELLSLPNTNTGGYFWAVMLIVFFIIVLIALLNYGFEIAALIATISTLTVGIFLVYAELIAWKIMLIPFGMFALMILYIFFSSRGENV
jgi:hypothetical protein